MKSNETQIAANRTTQNLAAVRDTPLDAGAIMTDYAQTVSKKDQSLEDEDYSIPQESQEDYSEFDDDGQTRKDVRVRASQIEEITSRYQMKTQQERAHLNLSQQLVTGD